MTLHIWKCGHNQLRDVIPVVSRSFSLWAPGYINRELEGKEMTHNNYDILPTALLVLEDEPKHRREVSPIETFPFDELTDVHEVWIHTD